MIADSISVVLVCIMPAQQLNEVKQNRFTEAFEHASKESNKKYHLDMEALKHAAHEAAILADEKTKAEREEVVKPVFDVNALFRKEE